jgi:nucleotide-binding universal stress UspA family protein
MSKVRVILHPSDFSRTSGAAFKKAVDLAREHGARLVIVNVIAPVPNVGDGYLSPEVREEIEASSRAYGERHLAALVGKAKNAGVRARSLVLVGSPHEQILRAARSARADVIVIGTHGRTGLAKLFLGSVASRVVAAARCPVVTIRGQ